MEKKKRVLFPKLALEKKQLLQQMKDASLRDLKWRDGKSFCLIYHPGEEKAKMIQEAYNLFFTENALNPTSFPSLRRFEAEVVSMVADLMNGDEEVCGTMTSGGTESILMAVKTARDYARKYKPKIISQPEIIAPITAHPAFDKACHYFDVKLIHVPVDENFRADINAVEKNINKNTIMLVGSAPAYPHGMIDPIATLSEIAIKNNLLLHVDACIGGFMLPFAKKIGYPIPAFDFSLKGVSSISADLHKYGYAAKGASVILYKNKALRELQFFVYTNWPGGIYGSPAMAGSRAGGSVAAAWAAIVGIGENGYLEMAKATLETTNKIINRIRNFPELRIMGKPEMSLVAFDSELLNVYEIADELNILGWHFERLQNPPAIHLTINQIHTQVADDFLNDLQLVLEKVKKNKIKNLKNSIQVTVVKSLRKFLPEKTLSKLQMKFSGAKALSSKRSAPMYGMMGALSGSDDLYDIVVNILNKLNALE